MGHITLLIRDAIHATKAVKGQSVTDFLIEHLDLRTTKLYEDLPDELAEVYMTQTSFEEHVWQLFFDGASRTGPRENIIVGVRVVLVSSQNYVIPHALSTELCSNNVAEYNAPLIGIQITDEIVLKISKRIMIQNSSSRFAGSTKSDMNS